MPSAGAADGWNAGDQLRAVLQNVSKDSPEAHAAHALAERLRTLSTLRWLLRHLHGAPAYYKALGYSDGLARLGLESWQEFLDQQIIPELQAQDAAHRAAMNGADAPKYHHALQQLSGIFATYMQYGTLKSVDEEKPREFASVIKNMLERHSTTVGHAFITRHLRTPDQGQRLAGPGTPIALACPPDAHNRTGRAAEVAPGPLGNGDEYAGREAMELPTQADWDAILQAAAARFRDFCKEHPDMAPDTLAMEDPASVPVPTPETGGAAYEELVSFFKAIDTRCTVQFQCGYPQFDAVVSSPFLRALQTAGLLRWRLIRNGALTGGSEAPIIVDPRLAERGLAKNRHDVTYEQLRREADPEMVIHTETKAVHFLEVEGMQPAAAFLEESLHAGRELAAEYAGKHVWLVTHGSRGVCLAPGFDNDYGAPYDVLANRASQFPNGGIVEIDFSDVRTRDTDLYLQDNVRHEKDFLDVVQKLRILTVQNGREHFVRPAPAPDEDKDEIYIPTMSLGDGPPGFTLARPPFALKACSFRDNGWATLNRQYVCAELHDESGGPLVEIAKAVGGYMDIRIKSIDFRNTVRCLSRTAPPPPSGVEARSRHSASACSDPPYESVGVEHIHVGLGQVNTPSYYKAYIEFATRVLQWAERAVTEPVTLGMVMHDLTNWMPSDGSKLPGA